MIKIEHPDLDIIAKKYFNDIKERIKKRTDFLMKVLNVLFNGHSYNILEQDLLNGNSKNSLTNQFLNATNQIKKQTQYSKVAIGNIQGFVAGNKIVLQNITSYLSDYTNLEEIILCSPENAISTENKVKGTIGLPADITPELQKYINSIIDYSLFDNYAYDVAKELNVNTCPYCNRNYINTVIDKNKKRIIRPTFDHFFPQTHHPLLALSFYNLIPSCYYCNSSLKSATRTSIDTHIHPYYEGYDSDTTFNVVINRCKPAKSDPENYLLEFKDNTNPLSPNDRFRKIYGGTRTASNVNEGNLNLFKLQDIYQSHLDIVGELIVKCDKLNSWYAGSLLGIFELLGTNKSEFYQYYFGNYINEKDFNRRPMAKLTKDVVSQRLPKFVK